MSRHHSPMSDGSSTSQADPNHFSLTILPGSYHVHAEVGGDRKLALRGGRGSEQAGVSGQAGRPQSKYMDVSVSVSVSVLLYSEPLLSVLINMLM